LDSHIPFGIDTRITNVERIWETVDENIKISVAQLNLPSKSSHKPPIQTVASVALHWGFLVDLPSPSSHLTRTMNDDESQSTIVYSSSLASPTWVFSLVLAIRNHIPCNSNHILQTVYAVSLDGQIKSVSRSETKRLPATTDILFSHVVALLKHQFCIQPSFAEICTIDV